MRFSEPPPPQNPPSSANTRIAITIITFVVTLVAAHIITVIIIAVGSDEPKSTTSDVLGSSIILTAPPFDIRDQCDENGKSKHNDEEKCETLCADVECCFVPYEYDSSCVQNNKDVCEQYAPCKVFYEGLAVAPSSKEIPPAPYHILEICSLTNVVTIDGFNECVNVCLKAECCTADSESDNCRAENKDTCESYEPCKVLTPNANNDDDYGDGDDTTITDYSVSGSGTVQDGFLTEKDMTLLIHQACNEKRLTTGDGGSSRVACNALCKNKQCCIDWICEDESFCDGFEACTILSELDIFSNGLDGSLADDAVVLTSLKSDSSSSDISPDNQIADSDKDIVFDDSEDFASSDDGKSSDDNGTDDYAEDPWQRDAVDKACTSLDDKTQFQVCEKLCESQLCCFLHGVHGCRDSRSDECRVYDSCKFLMPESSDDNEIAFVKKMIDQTCDDDMFDKPQEFQKCHEFCDENLCCFEDGNKSCKNDRDGKFQCEIYDSCKIFLRDDEEEDVYGSREVKALIDEVCDIDVFHIPEDFNECTEMCHHNMCCFKEGAESCVTNRAGKYDCNVYDSCKVLIGYNGNPHNTQNREEHEVKALIDETCNIDMFNDPDHFSYCKAMCDDNLCCFRQDGENCQNRRQNKWDCSVYEACERLVNDKGEKPVVSDGDKFGSAEVKALISEICDESVMNSNKKRQDCKEVCEMNMCCFSDGVDECTDNRVDKYDCDVYQACEIMDSFQRHLRSQ